MTTCSNCDKELTDGVNSCDDCVTAVIVEAQEENENTAQGNPISGTVITKPKNKLFLCHLLPIVCAIAVVAIIIICVSMSGRLTNKSMQKMLDNSEYNMTSVKIIYEIDWGTDNYNKFVLLNGYVEGERVFLPFFVNTKEKRIQTPTYIQFLGAVHVYIGRNEDRETNIELFKIMANYFKKYGIDSLADYEHCNEFLNEITLSKNMIPIEKTRDIIANHIDLTSNGYDTELFFEKGTAIPRYAAVKTSKLVYNWDSLFPEDQYKYYSAGASYDTQNTLEAIYGPPYVMGNVWEVHKVTDKMEAIGEYYSLDTIAKQFNVDPQDTISNANDVSNSKNNSEKTESISTSTSSENSNISKAVTEPAYEMYTDNEYGFQCRYPSHFIEYDDSEASTRYSVKSDDGRVKEKICVKKQNGTTVDTELNNFISTYSGNTTYKTSGSDYYAVSVDDGTTEHYRFCKFKNGNMYWFEIHSPSNEHEIYDKYINDIYAEFHITK